jgi:hypothetical protein
MTAAKTKDQHAAHVQKYLHQAELALRIGNGLLISELLWNATEQALKVFGKARGMPSDTVEDRWRIADILDQEDGNDLRLYLGKLSVAEYLEENTRLRMLDDEEPAQCYPSVIQLIDALMAGAVKKQHEP